METIARENNAEIICAVPGRSPKSLEDLRMHISGEGREVSIEGDRKIGTVINIAQIHYTLNEGPESYNDPERFRLLGMYQKAIYGELIARKVKHIFVEGFRLVDAHRNLELWKKEKKPWLKNPILRQDLFVKFGGAMVYYLENSDVKIYPTEDVASHKGLDTPGVACETQNAIHKKREDFTVQSVKKLLDRSPGLDVAIVYGSRHKFDDNVKEAFGEDLPRLERVYFPAQAEKFLRGKD